MPCPAAALALAVLALPQSKALPSEADSRRASERLRTSPDDPDANLTAGKHAAFVLGDYKAGLPLLAKSSDKALKDLAEHELDPDHVGTAPKKVAMGDEWVLAARRFQPLSRIFFDRASHWYIQAWPDLDDFWRMNLREQGRKLSAARLPGSARKTVPNKWSARVANPVPDGTFARTGSYSIKVPHGDPKIRPSETQVWSDPIPAGGGKVEFSAYVRTDGTDAPDDQVYLLFFDKSDAIVHGIQAALPNDIPFWQRVSGKADIPINVAHLRIGVAVRSAKGDAWADDLSVKIDGKEALRNPSFEEK